MIHRDRRIRQGGYSLIELLTVLVIIIVLGMIGVRFYEQFTKKSRDEERILSLQRIAVALEQYKTAHGLYPCGRVIVGSFTEDSSENTPWLNGAADPDDCQGEPKNGLIGQNILVEMPADPLNLVAQSSLAPYYFGYKVTADRTSFILHAKLEEDTERESADGGACATLYEMGSGLGTIVPSPEFCD